MEEHWVESLDVDDSDLHPPTLLRPCNQHRLTNQTNSITTTTVPSQTLDTLQESPPQSRTIPGPAGIVQAAKLRKARDIANCLGQEEHPIATQEYIRKVVEDPEEDENFKRSPWLSAIEFLHHDGMFNSASISHLGEIYKCQKHGKLDQVVAVIKSCTPNELGDMTVALKDPTGTVAGTIHHKVLTEGDFRKGISVGSVLVLHKVSVFSPSRSTHYLNITKRNLVKVFYKDGGSSQKQTFHGTIDAAPHYEDSGQGTPTLGSALYLERGAEDITNRLKRSNTNNEQENMSYTDTTNKDTNLKIASDKETLKEANVIENAGQLNTNAFGWTDEQIEELLDFDDI